MKELSIEQKAKLYDEALERMKAWVKGEHPECFTEAQKAAEFIFPELKESENDRIRKAIMEFFELQDDNTTYSFIPKKDILTWLEKQGSYTKKDVDDAYLKGISDAKNEIEKQYEANYQIRKDIATFIFNYRGDLKDRAKWMNYLGIKVSFVKNQDEQNPQPSLTPKSALEAAKEKKVDNQNCVNPTDGVEPRFHEGEWVVTSYGKVNQVVTVDEDGDGFTLDDYTYFSGSWCDMYHLWTIQDAKDGDVLFGRYGTFIFMGKGCGYCGVLSDNTFISNTGNNEWTEDLCPATKNQRDLLFKKMRKAGYEWDADKKKLKKIDDEEVNGEDYGIDGFWHAKRILEKTLGSVSGYQTDDGILDHKAAITTVKKLYEQKPTWTEEDEKRLNSCLIILQPKTLVGNTETINTKWLKSLKERMGG